MLQYRHGKRSDTRAGGQAPGVNVVAMRRMVHAGRIDAYTLASDAQRPVYRTTRGALNAFRERGRVCRPTQPAPP